MTTFARPVRPSIPRTGNGSISATPSVTPDQEVGLIELCKDLAAMKQRPQDELVLYLLMRGLDANQIAISTDAALDEVIGISGFWQESYPSADGNIGRTIQARMGAGFADWNRLNSALFDPQNAPSGDTLLSVVSQFGVGSTIEEKTILSMPGKVSVPTKPAPLRATRIPVNERPVTASAISSLPSNRSRLNGSAHGSRPRKNTVVVSSESPTPTKSIEPRKPEVKSNNTAKKYDPLTAFEVLFKKIMGTKFVKAKYPAVAIEVSDSERLDLYRNGKLPLLSADDVRQALCEVLGIKDHAELKDYYTDNSERRTNKAAEFGQRFAEHFGGLDSTLNNFPTLRTRELIMEQCTYFANPKLLDGLPARKPGAKKTVTLSPAKIDKLAKDKVAQM